jgi:hypothetical protein
VDNDILSPYYFAIEIDGIQADRFFSCEEIVNENFEDELKQEDEKNSVEHIPHQQVAGHPISLFTTRFPHPSTSGTTLYSSNRQLMVRQLNTALAHFHEQHSGHTANPPPPHSPTSWTFFDLNLAFRIPSVIVTTIYEAVERSDHFISNVRTRDGFDNFTILR